MSPNEGEQLGGARGCIGVFISLDFFVLVFLALFSIYPVPRPTPDTIKQEMGQEENARKKKNVGERETEREAW